MRGTLFLLVLMGECSAMMCQLYEYHYITEMKSWEKAQEFCRGTYTDLLTVTNTRDVKRLLSDSPADMTDAWIGLYQLPNSVKKSYWSLTGEEFKPNEANWHEGEPNDEAGKQNCGIVDQGLMWGDQSCLEKYYFFCYNERKTSDKYYLIKENKTWLEAQSYCRENHTDLISGRTQLNDPQLTVGVDDCESQYIFMGLFKDTWTWSDGSSSSFRHWSLHFDNDQYSAQQCAVIVFKDGGRWKNESCTEKKPFICYKHKVILVKQKMTWENALYYCRDHYHDLVAITGPEQQKMVEMEAQRASTDFVWMGLRYTCTLDLWFWVSDQVVSYENWASEEMNDCDLSGAMKAKQDHKWFKKQDNKKFNFICSRH